MSTEISRRFFIGAGAATITVATVSHPAIAVAKSGIEKAPDPSKLREILAGRCQQRLPSRVTTILKDEPLGDQFNNNCTQSKQFIYYSPKEMELLSGRHIKQLKP